MSMNQAAKRILYITPWRPSLNNGGERHCYANLRSLCEYPGASVDYIGASFTAGLEGLKDNLHVLMARDFNFRDKITAAVYSSASSLIAFLRQISSNGHSFSGYDLVFIESTRCGFAFDYVRGHQRVICNVHNVEVDYIQKNLRFHEYLTSRNIYKSEERTILESWKLLLMHQYDLARLQDVHHLQIEQSRIFYHPVCSFSPEKPLVPFKKRNRNLVFSGSLDCHYNENGLIKFLDTSWPQIQGLGYKLIVAGRNPGSNLLRQLQNYSNVKVVANPPSMEDIVRDCVMLILPDLSGTGMKLRVAEALSLGVPVVGTEMGLRGYQDIPSYGVVVDSVEEMAAPIASLLLPKNESLEAMSANAVDAWRRMYCFDAFKKRIHGVLNCI